MSKNIRIRSRIDDKLKVQMDKKLSQKKFSNYDESKFIRAAIENFIVEFKIRTSSKYPISM